MHTLLPFLPSQSLPGLGDCVIDQCTKTRTWRLCHRSAEDLGLLCYFTNCFQGLCIRPCSEQQWDSLLSLSSLSLPGAVHWLPKACSLAACCSHLSLLWVLFPHHWNWWQNQIQVSVIMGPAEQPVPDFSVPAHLITSAAVPAISLTCALLQLLSVDCPSQARFARGLASTIRGQTDERGRGECAHMPACF